MTRFEMRFPVQIRPLVAPFLHRLFTQTASQYRFIVPEIKMNQLLVYNLWIHMSRICQDLAALTSICSGCQMSRSIDFTLLI